MTPANQKALSQLFTQYNVLAYVSGHVHCDSDVVDLGVRNITTKGLRAMGAYRLLKVCGSTLTVEKTVCVDLYGLWTGTYGSSKVSMNVQYINGSDLYGTISIGRTTGIFHAVLDGSNISIHALMNTEQTITLSGAYNPASCEVGYINGSSFTLKHKVPLEPLHRGCSSIRPKTVVPTYDPNKDTTAPYYGDGNGMIN
jgi:hypothetical protein